LILHSHFNIELVI